ncbi:hypothetical protein [Glutamicibacter creatinolyticus]|uniref:hypothetical protein n=1 Tax=Glutamicibacter creatinolyticus TaxID=162496 RepID=UPI00321772DC
MDLFDLATRVRAMEGKRRLYRVWQKLDERGKKRTKANTAVAREMTGWLWSVAEPLQR